MRTFTSVETGGFKMAADILRTVQRLNKLGNLDPMLLYALVATKKGLGASSKRPSDSRRSYIQCKSECAWSGSTFQYLWLWVCVKGCVTFLCNI